MTTLHQEQSVLSLSFSVPCVAHTIYEDKQNAQSLGFLACPSAHLPLQYLLVEEHFEQALERPCTLLLFLWTDSESPLWDYELLLVLLLMCDAW